MAYDEGLATRLRELFADQPGVVAKRMFGGLAVMLDGNMAVGVYGDDLLIRADPAEREQLLGRPGVREFVMGRATVKGFLLVAAQACAEDEELASWVEIGAGYARRLPPK